MFIGDNRLVCSSTKGFLAILKMFIELLKHFNKKKIVRLGCNP